MIGLVWSKTFLVLVDSGEIFRDRAAIYSSFDFERRMATRKAVRSLQRRCDNNDDDDVDDGMKAGIESQEGICFPKIVSATERWNTDVEIFEGRI